MAEAPQGIPLILDVAKVSFLAIAAVAFDVIWWDAICIQYYGIRIFWDKTYNACMPPDENVDTLIQPTVRSWASLRLRKKSPP